MKVWAVGLMDGSGEAVGVTMGKSGAVGVLVMDGEGEHRKVSEVVKGWVVVAVGVAGTCVLR